jgi:hypothetical protein
MSKQLNSESVARYYAGADGAGGSNYMASCVMALAISHSSVRCRACKGQGYCELSEAALRDFAQRIAGEKNETNRDQIRRDLSYQTTCKGCKGSGWTTQKRADRAAAIDSMFTTVRCGRCRGCGEVTTPTDTSAERQDVCLSCGGAAYIVPVTVKETGSTKDGREPRREAGDASDTALAHAPVDEDDELEQLHDVAEELERVRAQDPQLAAALASYHGPEGEGWIQHRWGRGFVLWQHTAAGKQLVTHLAERSPHRSGYLVPPTRLLAEDRATQEQPGSAASSGRDGALVRVLLTRARDKARELLLRMQCVVAEHQVA